MISIIPIFLTVGLFLSNNNTLADEVVIGPSLSLISECLGIYTFCAVLGWLAVKKERKAASTSHKHS